MIMMMMTMTIIFYNGGAQVAMAVFSGGEKKMSLAF